MKKVIFCFALFSVIAFVVSGQNVSDFEFETENGGITITEYTPISFIPGVIMPGKINNLPVLTIGDDAFHGKSLTTLFLNK